MRFGGRENRSKLYVKRNLLEQFLSVNNSSHNQGIIFCKVTRLRAGRYGVWIPLWDRDPSLLRNVQTGSASTQSPIQCVPGFHRWVMRPARQVNQSSPSGVDVKNEWMYTFTPHVCLRSLDRDEFIFCNFIFYITGKSDFIQCYSNSIEQNLSECRNIFSVRQTLHNSRGTPKLLLTG